MSALKVPTIFSAVDKFSSPVRKMSSQMTSFAQKAERSVARLDRRFRRLTPSLGGLGRQMLAFASTGALIAGVGDAINVVKDFEQANADLSAVMSSATSKQLEALQKDAARLGGATAKTATEVVGLQEAFARLGFETNDIINMTEATISGSIAMNAELAETAELTGAMIKTFDSLSSVDTPQVIDQMTLATQKSALNFEKLQTSLPIVGGAAEAAGISFERTLALLGKLSDAGIDASSSATSLRNIFLESAKEGLSYEQILTKIEKNQDKLTAANDAFGKRAAVSATVLSKNIRSTAELTDTLEKARKGQELSGAASDAAGKRLNTFGGALTLLRSKWEGYLIAQNDGTGAIGKMTTAVQWLTENLESIVKWAAILTGAWLAMKVMLIATKGALLAYNIVLGVSSALSKTASIAVGQNTVALNAYNIASKAAAFFTKIWTGAQWLLNIALNANPIGVVVVAILALVAVTALIIKNYEKWGAALTLILGPFGTIINMIMAFKNNWEGIKKAFKDGGIKLGIIAIGKTIVDAMLVPMQQLLELASKIPGLSIAGVGAEKIQALRDKLALEERDVAAINPKEEEQQALTQRIENTKNTNATLTVNAPKGAVSVDADDDFPVIESSTGMAFN